jgi:hypothetical protein
MFSLKLISNFPIVRHLQMDLFRNTPYVKTWMRHVFIPSNIVLIFLISIVGGEVQLGSLDIAATKGLLCKFRVIMMMEKLVE